MQTYLFVQAVVFVCRPRAVVFSKRGRVVLFFDMKNRTSSRNSIAKTSRAFMITRRIALSHKQMEQEHQFIQFLRGGFLCLDFDQA